MSVSTLTADEHNILELVVGTVTVILFEYYD
jgi:hypothetical protein